MPLRGRAQSCDEVRLRDEPRSTHANASAARNTKARRLVTAAAASAAAPAAVCSSGDALDDDRRIEGKKIQIGFLSPIGGGKKLALFFLLREREISPQSARKGKQPSFAPHRPGPSPSGRIPLQHASSIGCRGSIQMAALLKSGTTKVMMMGPSSATMTLSSCSPPPTGTSSRPSLQSRRGPTDARQSSGNTASSSGIGGGSGSGSGSGSCSRATSSSSSSSGSGLRMRTRAAAGVRLAGSGSSAPAHVLTNADLSQLVETNDEWIAQRTGIRCVRFLVFRRHRRRRLSATSRSSGRDRSKLKEKRRAFGSTLLHQFSSILPPSD